MNYSFFRTSSSILGFAIGAGGFLIGIIPSLATENQTNQNSHQSSINRKQILANNQVDSTAKSATAINKISQKTTLLLFNVNNNKEYVSHGSGSLIAKNQNTCIGITNRHVVPSNGEQVAKTIVRTYDNKQHEVTKIKRLESIDLAVVKFKCEQKYEPITMAKYQLSSGQPVYLSGWPPSRALDAITRQFTSGSISTVQENASQGKADEGYKVGYTNVTQKGMSGGQVLDAAGRLVAIHGVGDRNAEGNKTGINYGIPVSIVLEKLSQNNIYYSYNISQNPVQGKVVQGEVAQPDTEDKVSFDEQMDKIDRFIETADKVCDFLGC